MAYQNVGTCRFYIDQFQYLKSKIGMEDLYDYISPDSFFPTTAQRNGGWHWVEENSYRFTSVAHPELFTLDPINRKELYKLGEHETYAYSCILPTGFFGKQDLSGDNVGRYVAILNHNLGIDSAFNCHSFWWEKGAASGEGSTSISLAPILNCETNEGQVVTHNTGSTIYEFDKNGEGFNPPATMYPQYIWINFSNQNHDNYYPNLELGALSYGIYYDMPNSADLDLTMTTEFDGAKSTQTLGGSTLTNTTYAGAPWWYDVDGNKVEPWAIGETNGIIKRNGRRTWKLNFSYISDENIFASNYMSNNYLEPYSDNSDYNSEDMVLNSNNNPIDFEYTLEDDNSFVSQVLQKVGNGQRFIFQPDNTNNNPDQFAICVLDQDSLDIKQVAYKVYDISLKIKEVW